MELLFSGMVMQIYFQCCFSSILQSYLSLECYHILKFFNLSTHQFLTFQISNFLFFSWSTFYLSTSSFSTFQVFKFYFWNFLHSKGKNKLKIEDVRLLSRVSRMKKGLMKTLKQYRKPSMNEMGPPMRQHQDCRW